jgi:gliding motility-associated-like protein
VGQPARFASFDGANTSSVFNWQITGGGNQTGNVIITTWQQSGAYIIRLIGRTAFGCADTVTRNIRVNPTPVVNAGRDVTICLGQSIQLNATAPGPVLWTPDQGLSCNTCANPIANPNFTTEYFVSNTNTFGCIGTDSMLVNVAQPFTMNVVPNDTICFSRNETAQLFASNAIRYQWTPTAGLSANNIPNPVARPASTTTYRVVGFDAENCFTDTGYVTIAVGYNPTVSLPPGALVVAGTQVTLTPTLTGAPFARYTWTPNRDLSCNNCPNPVATINNDIIYNLEVETIYGCTARDTVGYTVVCQKDQVFIPNAFSPDGDGVNDILMVRGKGVSTVKSFRIFNRYGQVVFEKQNFTANDPSAGWDGKVNGVPASPDVYVFTAEVLCTAGANYVYKGNITLFR